MEINQLLQQNSFAVNELLRQYNIIAPDMATGIKNAYSAYGEKFMIKLVNQLSGRSAISGFDPSTDMGPPAPPGSTVVDGITQVQDQASAQFWQIWSNVLSYVGQTGTTFQNLKQNITGTTTTDVPYTNEGTNMTWLYIGGGLLAVVILLILIFKK